MTLRADLQSLIPGRLLAGHRGLGVPGGGLAATGSHGPGCLYRHASLPADAAVEFRAELVAPPASGSLTIYEDGAFVLTGVPGGQVVWFAYRLWRAGQDMGRAMAIARLGDTPAPALADGMTVAPAVASVPAVQVIPSEGNTLRADASLIPDKLVAGDRGLGLLGAAIPPGSAIYSRVEVADAQSDEVRVEVLQVPSAAGPHARFTAFEDGTWAFTGAPVNQYGYAISLRMWVNGQPWGDPFALWVAGDSVAVTPAPMTVVAQVGAAAADEQRPRGLTLEGVGGAYRAAPHDLGVVRYGRVEAQARFTTHSDAPIDDVTQPIDEWTDLDGDGLPDVTVSLWLRTTRVDPAIESGWSEWSRFAAAADFEARALQIELRADSPDPARNLIVRSLNWQVVLYAHVQAGADLLSSGLGTRVDYATRFVESAQLTITPQDLAPGDYWTIADKSLAGFTVTFYNAGQPIARRFDWIAYGY